MNATRTQAPPITVEQYEHFEGYPGLRDELIFGEIVMSPHAKPLHQQIAKNVETLLDRLVVSTDFVVSRDTNIKVPQLNSMPSPDVFVVQRDLWFEACRREEHLSTPPLLTVEVLSPANRKTHIASKVEVYLTAGVASVWTINPKRKTVCVKTPQSETVYQLHEAISLDAPLKGRVSLTDIFRLE